MTHQESGGGDPYFTDRRTLEAADLGWDAIVKRQSRRIAELEADLSALGQENQRLRDALGDARPFVVDICDLADFAHVHQRADPAREVVDRIDTLLNLGSWGRFEESLVHYYDDGEPIQEPVLMTPYVETWTRITAERRWWMRLYIRIRSLLHLGG